MSKSKSDKPSLVSFVRKAYGPGKSHDETFRGAWGLNIAKPYPLLPRTLELIDQWTAKGLIESVDRDEGDNRRPPRTYITFNKGLFLCDGFRTVLVLDNATDFVAVIPYTK